MMGINVFYVCFLSNVLGQESSLHSTLYKMKMAGQKPYQQIIEGLRVLVL